MAVLLGAASGALWFAALNALLVFRTLVGDPATGGRVAAVAFSGSYWVCACATALAFIWAPVGRWCGAAIAVCLLLQLGAVVPALTAHGVGWPGSFASLHATASLVHLGLAVLMLVWAIKLATWQRLKVVAAKVAELP